MRKERISPVRRFSPASAGRFSPVRRFSPASAGRFSPVRRFSPATAGRLSPASPGHISQALAGRLHSAGRLRSAGSFSPALAAHLSQKVVNWRASAAGRARCERVAGQARPHQRVKNSIHRMTSAAEQKMIPSAVRASSFRVGIRTSCTFRNSEIIGDRVQVAAGLIELSHTKLALV
jgi:hypothetical protein